MIHRTLILRRPSGLVAAINAVGAWRRTEPQWVSSADRVAADVGIKIDAPSLTDRVTIEPTRAHGVIGAIAREIQTAYGVIEISCIFISPEFA
jgi:hypothetical protein